MATQQQSDLTEKISEMYKKLLFFSGVEYIPSSSEFVVFNNESILFSISYNKFLSDYRLRRSGKLLSEYKERKLDTKYAPNTEKLYSWVNFYYVFYNTFKKQDKNVEHLFNRTLAHTEIAFNPGPHFETYKIYAMEQLLYAIGFNKETNQYGFKRYLFMDALYEALQIPKEAKPDYPKLYKNVKDMYLAQCATENVQHMYD